MKNGRINQIYSLDFCRNFKNIGQYQKRHTPKQDMLKYPVFRQSFKSIYQTFYHLFPG